jgi:hypothetical protein
MVLIPIEDARGSSSLDPCFAGSNIHACLCAPRNRPQCVTVRSGFQLRMRGVYVVERGATHGVPTAIKPSTVCAAHPSTNVGVLGFWSWVFGRYQPMDKTRTERSKARVAEQCSRHWACT